jgi:hypothetical protein
VPLRRLTFLLLVVATCACGRDRVTGPTPPPEDDQVISGSVAAFGTTRHAITISSTGQLSVRLTWDSNAVDLDLYLPAATCTALYPLESCSILAVSDAASGTSEQLTRAVSAGQSYGVFVDNLNIAQAQSYTLTIAVD